jgi:hypothetical protein
MMDYLAEVSLSLLARARLKSPDAGFPPDFVQYLKPHLAELARRGIKVVSNAGGVNPRACKAALAGVCAELGLSLRIATVEGDDVLPLVDQLRDGDVREAVSGAVIPERLLTANAYLGALPIKTALDLGADIVITGRCADSALALGILMHEFGWASHDYDRLAAGSLAGHLLECGAQGVGGLHTDWQLVPDWENIGYPIAECQEDGSFVLTKPPGTGGLVIPGSVAEQVLYEIGDPAAYVLPDLVADFSRVALQQVGPDRVRVSGARGRAPTAQYKVSATYQDGYRAMATVSIVGPQAAAKAERTAEALVKERGLPDFTATHWEALGAEASYGPQSRARDSREALLRLVVLHDDAKCLELFARELGSVGISFAPGTTGIYTGRPKASPQIRLFTLFVDKNRLQPPVVELDAEPISIAIPGGSIPGRRCVRAAAAGGRWFRQVGRCPSAAVGVGALGRQRRLGEHCDHCPRSEVCRRVTPGSHGEPHRGAFSPPGRRSHSTLRRARSPCIQLPAATGTGRGGMASLRIDPQGKAYGQMALELIVNVPCALLREVEGR